jgi:UDP-N-acetylmuramate dehydrogenase
MDIRQHPSLKERTTLRLGGRARAELVIGQDSDWDEAARFLEREGGPPFLLGGGSNLLAADGELPHILLRNELPRQIEPLQETDTELRLRVGGGVRLPRLMGWSAKRGLSGLEPLAGIPGTVGGAAAMNAGSFGREFCRAVARLQIWTPEQGLRWYGLDELIVGYRHLSLVREQQLFGIHRLELVMGKDSPERVRSALQTYYQRKKSSQPVLSWTCGCVFKNPESARPAGAMLDECGLRGRRLGKVGFSEQHANFLINQGQGESREAFELIRLAREAVRRRYGLHLELEVQTLDRSEQ